MERLDHDAAYKAIYGHRFMVEELVRWRVPLLGGGRQLVDALDFEGLDRVQEQSVAGGRRRSSDIVWRVPLRDRVADDPDCWLHIMLMLEFQSSVDYLMALRCRQYVDAFHLENWRGLRFGPTDRLPPVLVFVIYNGEARWRAARRVVQLVTPNADLAEDDLSQSSPLFAGDGYVMVDSGGIGPDDLQRDNAASLLAGMEYPDPGAVPERLAKLLRRVAGQDLRELREILTDWTTRVVARRLGLDLEIEMAELDRMGESEELEVSYEARRKAWVDGYRAEGRAEALVEARVMERARLCRQAGRRFNAGAAERLAVHLEAVEDAADLDEVADWLVDCASGDELIERIHGAGRVAVG